MPKAKLEDYGFVIQSRQMPVVSVALSKFWRIMLIAMGLGNPFNQVEK
jgi:hypothetical protein